MRNNGDDAINRPRTYNLTAAERRMLVDRHFERAELRQAEHDLDVAKLLQLGAALQRPNQG